MGAPWKLEQGQAGRWTVTVRNAQQQPVTTYTGTEALAGVVWAGDDQSPFFNLNPVWNVPAAGLVDVPIVAAQSAMLAVGTYALQVGLADATASFYRGELEIIPSAGLGPVLFSYVSYQQLMSFAAQVGRLQDLVADRSQFSEQRNQASLDFDRLVMNRYRPQPGRSRRYLNAARTGPGPFMVYGTGPAGQDAPPAATIAGYLGTSKLLVNADIIESICRGTLAIIYLGQPGRDNVYRETGTSELALSRAAFARALVEFDLNADGLADIRVDQDVIWMT